MSVIKRSRLTTAAATLAIAFGAGHVMQFGFGIGFGLQSDLQQPAPRPSRTRPADTSGAMLLYNPLMPAPATASTNLAVPGEPMAVAEPASFPFAALGPIVVPEDASVLSDAATGIRAEALGTICEVGATAIAAPGAVIRVELDACERDVPVAVSHAGLDFMETTGSNGRMTVLIPAFDADAEVQLSVAGQPAITLAVAVPDADWYDRVALVWDGSAALSIRALEPGNALVGPVNVSTDDPYAPARAEAAEGGFLVVLGDPQLPKPALAEVYSFPSRRITGQGTVRLSVFAAVTEESCGRDVPVRILQSQTGGDPRDTQFSVAFPGCDAIGQHLVLKNLLEDLKVAQN